MRLLILGGCGFIGAHVVDRAREAGHCVRVFSRSPERHRAPLSGVDYRWAELGDDHALAEALTGCDAVLHLISSTNPATAEADPMADVADNLVTTLRLIRQMQAQGIARLLYLSSGGTVYGPPDHLPVPESHPLRPIGSYGIVKAAAEHYIQLAATRGLVPTILRPANAFGPRQIGTRTPGFLSTTLDRLARGEPVELFGDGSVVRDYLPVTDLAELCLRALEDGAGLTLNAGSGTGRSLIEALEVIARVTGRQPQVIRRPARSVDVPRSVLDIRRVRERLGWSPRKTFEEAIAETWAWTLAQV